MRTVISLLVEAVMPFKKGNPGTLRKGQTANRNGRPKGKTKTGLIPAAKKLTPTLIRELEKMAIGTNVPWAIKLEAGNKTVASCDSFRKRARQGMCQKFWHMYVCFAKA